MSDQVNEQGKKPDGSVFATRLAAVAERNRAAQKAGRERREEYELEKATRRRAAERLLNAELKAKH